MAGLANAGPAFIPTIMKKIVINLVLLFLPVLMFGQTVKLTFADTLFVEPGSTFSIDAKVVHFKQIGSFSFSLEWDTTKIRLIDFKSEVFPLAFTNVQGNMLKFAWASSSGKGESLPDKSTILKLQFMTNKEENTITPVSWLKNSFLEVYSYDGFVLQKKPVEIQDQIIVNRVCTQKLNLDKKINFCVHDSAQIRLPDQNYVDITWNTGEKAQTIWAKKAFWYKALVEWPQKCFSKDSVLAEAIALPNFELGEDTVICSNQSFHLSMPIDATKGLRYLWSTGEQTPDIKIFKPGIYTAALQEGKCTRFDTIMVSFEACKEEVYLPNAFRPLSQNTNNIFKPFYDPDLEFLFFQLIVIDRWGNLVFSSNSPENGWDGRVGNQLANPGIYVFRLKAEFKINTTKKQINRIGDILLVN